MACKCGSTRIISVGGDYIQIKVCADCGTLQGFNTDMTDDQIIEALAE